MMGVLEGYRFYQTMPGNTPVPQYRMQEGISILLQCLGEYASNLISHRVHDAATRRKLRLIIYNQEHNYSYSVETIIPPVCLCLNSLNRTRNVEYHTVNNVSEKLPAWHSSSICPLFPLPPLHTNLNPLHSFLFISSS